jgi:hypothetical protein
MKNVELPPGGLSMKHRTALILFAVALGVVTAVAFVTTLDRVNTVSSYAMRGTTGLVKPHHNSTAQRANQ